MNASKVLAFMKGLIRFNCSVKESVRRLLQKETKERLEILYSSTSHLILDLHTSLTVLK